MNTQKASYKSKGQKVTRKNKVLEGEKKPNVPSEAADNNRKKLKRKTSPTEEGILIKSKKELHNTKKKVASQLLELHEILGATKPPDPQETELEKLIFGCNPEELDDLEEDDHADLSLDEEKETPASSLQAAWEDEDDEHLFVREKAASLRNCHRSVSLRGEEKYADFAKEKFNKLVGAPKWAELKGLDDGDSDESDDELLRKTGNFVKKSEYLAKGNISIHKCPSLVDPSMKSSLVKTVEFHPTSRVALVASTNGTSNLFQIDGKINNKIQSIHFENFPIHTAHFTVDGNEIVVGSNKYAHFFTYDMLAGKIIRIPCQKGMDQRNIRRFHMSPDGKYIVIHGRYGNIHLMTSKTKEWIGSLKMNGEVIAITFNRDGTRMYSHGDTGEVYVWDMVTRKCIHKFQDEGCITGTALALSPNDQFFATGSDSGVVNVYDNSTLLKTHSPQPLKVLLNLTNEITHLKFNNTSEILAMSSSFKEDAVKLVHFPSLTVFSNFPTKSDSVKHPNSVDISINSGYLCIGNNFGSAYLYRLKHYKNY